VTTGLAVQNLGNTTTSYSGMLFYDQFGALGQFQGFNNVTHEYRINNIASGGSINFMLGSTSRFRVAPNGNVGIGTTTEPTSKLEINGAQDALQFTGYQPFMTLRDGNAGNARGRIQTLNGTLNLFTESYLNGTNSSAFLQLNTSGNVGIGVSNPGAKLHVATGSSTAIHATSQGNAVVGLSSTPNFAAIYGENTSGTSGYGVYGKSTGGTAIFADGNAGQSRDKGGLVKAMIYVHSSGAINRCYNGITNSSTGNCGFTITHNGVGVYQINFGFQVDDRFLSVTAHIGGGNVLPNNMGANFSFPDSTTVSVITFDANGGEDSYPRHFMIIVF
jgi:hypothetical protein